MHQGGACLARWFLFFLFCCGWSHGWDGDLCGTQQSEVCLTNSRGLAVSGAPELLPGTAVVFSVPGVRSSGPAEVFGTATEPYRLQATGSASDNAGGIWSDAVVLAEDALGPTAIAFYLQQGRLPSPFQLFLQNITVCQRVADGPRSVSITHALWATAFKRPLENVRVGKMESAFRACTQNTGSLPLPQAHFRMTLSNPHDDRVTLTLPHQTYSLRPGQQLEINDDFNSGWLAFAADHHLPAVLWSEEADLNLIGWSPENQTQWHIPHVARNRTTWNNYWIFAGPDPVTLKWTRGTDQTSKEFDSGSHLLQLPAADEAQTSAVDIQANHPINGFFHFTRADGSGGGAWLNALGESPTGNLGENSLTLPHVAGDRNSFWTGFALTNPGPKQLQVVMDAMDDNGFLVASETYHLNAGDTQIGTIGGTHFAGLDGVSWLEIHGDGPLSGISLIGATHPSESRLAGYLLPASGAGRLAFPLLMTDDPVWSGLVLINKAAVSDVVSVFFLDREGIGIETRTLSLEPGQKVVLRVPPGVSQARVVGEQVMGLCLIGQPIDLKLGGYLGLPY